LIPENADIIPATARERKRKKSLFTLNIFLLNKYTPKKDSKVSIKNIVVVLKGKIPVLKRKKIEIYKTIKGGTDRNKFNR
jgi:hypothetical protein